MEVLEKAAEILVESGYAGDINKDHVAIPHQCGEFGEDVDWEFQLCNPFIDSIDGRRQADAIEDWLIKNHLNDLWAPALIAVTNIEKGWHKRRMQQTEWCLEQLANDS